MKTIRRVYAKTFNVQVFEKCLKLACYFDHPPFALGFLNSTSAVQEGK